MYMNPNSPPLIALSFNPPPDILPDQLGHNNHLRRRQGDNARPSVTTIVVLACLVGFIILIITYFIVRTVQLRRRKKKKANQSPGIFRVLSHRFGDPNGSYHQAHDDDSLDGSSRRPRVTFLPPADRTRSPNPGSTNANNDSNTNANGSAGAGSRNTAIDRNTSVRSVMTLPAYKARAGDTERVLGREGERDGVDVVIEMLTAEEEEQMRDNEMQALYELRMARRREAAEREERRRQRRDARARNDTAALSEIRARTRAASNNSMLEELRRDHDHYKSSRQRAASSVSYADLGVARHDGTRLRANSSESERIGLLSDAASIGAGSTRSGVITPTSHHRAPSASSILSADSDLPSPSISRTPVGSGAETPRPQGRAGSSPEIIEADVGDEYMPPHSPPRYDDVSLDDERSGAATPLDEPPPGYEYNGASRGRALQVPDNISGRAPERHSFDEPESTRPRDLHRASLPQIVIDRSDSMRLPERR